MLNKIKDAEYVKILKIVAPNNYEYIIEIIKFFENNGTEENLKFKKLIESTFNYNLIKYNKIKAEYDELKSNYKAILTDRNKLSNLLDEIITDLSNISINLSNIRDKLK